MVTRVRKIVFTPDADDPSEGVYEAYLYDPATDEAHFETLGPRLTSDMSDPLQWGLEFVTEHPDIDLPTS